MSSTVQTTEFISGCCTGSGGWYGYENSIPMVTQWARRQKKRMVSREVLDVPADFLPRTCG